MRIPHKPTRRFTQKRWRAWGVPLLIGDCAIRRVPEDEARLTEMSGEQ